MKHIEIVCAAAILTIFIASEAKPQATSTTATHVMVEPRDLSWQEGPEGLPPGAQYTVLEGDPTQPGPFTLRIKVPAGYRVMPHWHPADEHVTVIEGSVLMGLGEKFQERSMKQMSTGSFILLPARTHHYVMTRTGGTIQLHGMGPWGINYLNPADDPRQQAQIE
jgi:quercetin dioxygenase-like cupin family protein